MTTDVSKWVDVSAIVAATAALWALGFAWVTYVMSVRQEDTDELQAIKSIVNGLRIELEFMKDWTGFGGDGYSKTITLDKAPPDWSLPGRLIWKFDTAAISSLTRSPYLYGITSIVEPFARLNFSVSRLFQMYDEYRSFVNSDPAIFLTSRVSISEQHQQQVLRFNHTMHVSLIGGADSDDASCLYRAYASAKSALESFDANLKDKTLPPWFWFGHIVSVACFVSGGVLLYRLFNP